MQDPVVHANMNWAGKPNYPRSDYLSSSRKRLAPQLLFKGGIFHAWAKKQAVVVHRGFFNTLPKFAEVDPSEADLAWLIYELKHDEKQGLYRLAKAETVYTRFESTMLKITTSEAGLLEDFVERLQAKLDEKLDNNPPDAPTLTDIILI